jgi:hypothetical protein
MDLACLQLRDKSYYVIPAVPAATPHTPRTSAPVKDTLAQTRLIQFGPECASHDARPESDG